MLTGSITGNVTEDSTCFNDKLCLVAIRFTPETVKLASTLSSGEHQTPKGLM
jgi:hypothetical protein